jgi:alkylation response protein AidB-like acyl-CoA dehydrogenase
MYLAPDGEEWEIANAAAGFLAEVMPIARLHEASAPDMVPQVRASLGEMGWFALAVPSDQGGSGLSPVEHALFFREVGRQCGPIDILAQCLAANLVSDAALRDEIIAGAAAVALVVADGPQWRVLGHVDSPYGMIVTETEAKLIALSGVSSEPRPSLDPSNSLRTVSALPEPVAELVGAQIWYLGQLGAAAMLVGIAEAALALIVEYAKVRETFGRKIGSWQAVRHTCADMAVRVEAARSQLWYAAAALKECRADAAAHLDAAKYLANTGAVANADSNIQLHGGIGVTDEHDAHLLLKHALLLSRLFGAKRGLLGRLLHARVEN